MVTQVVGTWWGEGKERKGHIRRGQAGGPVAQRTDCPPGPALTLLTCWFPILITHGLDPHHRVTSDPRHRIAVAHRALTADARSVNGSCCFVIVFIVCRHTWLTPDPRSPGKHTHGQGVPQAGLLGPAELGTEELSPPFAG